MPLQSAKLMERCQMAEARCTAIQQTSRLLQSSELARKLRYAWPAGIVIVSMIHLLTCRQG